MSATYYSFAVEAMYNGNGLISITGTAMPKGK